jgi:hypothetical protein
MTEQTSWLRRHRNLITGLLLMLAAWAIYLTSVRYGFVYYDDVRILLDHPELYGQANLSADFREIFVTNFPREEPLLLRDVSWALDGRIFGFGNAFGYHLGNVLLHGIVVALMFAFLLGTTRRYGFALAVATGWLILAVHVEPVDWIMGRKDILSTLFMLLALCAQTRRLAAEHFRARCAWYSITLAFFMCGLLSKISVLTFPIVLFLHAVFLPYLNGERPDNGVFPWNRILVKEIFLFVPAFVASVMVYGWYRRTLDQMGVFDRGYTAHGLAHLWNLMMVNPLVIWVYVQQTFLPWHLQVLYTWPEILASYPHWQVLISLASLAGATGAGVWIFLRRKDLFFYYAAFFVVMIPYLNLIFSGIILAERYLYFSAFCLLALAAAVAITILQRARPLLRGGVLAAVGGFVILNLSQTFLYQPAWRNGETLWEYHLTLPETNPTAYANLAAYYYANFSSAFAQKNTTAMVSSIRKMEIVVNAGLDKFWSDRQQPPPPETYYLFFLQSLIQEVKGEPEPALASLLTSDQLRPKFDSTNLNLARLYRKLANASVDPKQREIYARNAQDRFAEYIAIEFRGRPAPPDALKEFEEIKNESSAASHSPAK